jgi:copper(I)-binding protein
MISMHFMPATVLRGLRHLAVVSFCLLAAGAQAQVTVKDPWVRGTVAQQKATGAFMQITAVAGGKLVSVTSPMAGVVEIHEMAMDGNVMKMRAVPALELPAGKAVELKPGGYHVMLMELRQALQPGQAVPLTLVVEVPGGRRETVQLSAPVRPLAAAPAHGTHGAHKH